MDGPPPPPPSEPPPDKLKKKKSKGASGPQPQPPEAAGGGAGPHSARSDGARQGAYSARAHTHTHQRALLWAAVDEAGGVGAPLIAPLPSLKDAVPMTGDIPPQALPQSVPAHDAQVGVSHFSVGQHEPDDGHWLLEGVLVDHNNSLQRADDAAEQAREQGSMERGEEDGAGKKRGEELDRPAAKRARRDDGQWLLDGVQRLDEAGVSRASLLQQLRRAGVPRSELSEEMERPGVSLKSLLERLQPVHALLDSWMPEGQRMGGLLARLRRGGLSPEWFEEEVKRAEQREENLSRCIEADSERVWAVLEHVDGRVTQLDDAAVWLAHWDKCMRKSALEAELAVNNMFDAVRSRHDTVNTRQLRRERERLFLQCHNLMHAARALNIVVAALPTAHLRRLPPARVVRSLDLGLEFAVACEQALELRRDWAVPVFGLPRLVQNDFKANLALNISKANRERPAWLSTAIEEFRAGLDSVRLGGSGIADTGAQLLAPEIGKLANLAELHLDGNQIGDIGARALAPEIGKLTNLTLLYLHRNQIGDIGARALAPEIGKLTNLTELFLSTNQIGDAGAHFLALEISKLTSLAKLRVSGNQIGDIGAQALAPEIGKLTSLSGLILSDNQIGDIGAQALAPEIGKLANLTLLGLHGNRIEDTGAQALAPEIGKLTKLTHMFLSDNRLTPVQKERMRSSAPATCKVFA